MTALSDIGPEAGDLAQVCQFFAALYFGTPLIGTYGEASLAALERRWRNCSEAVGDDVAEDHDALLLARDSLDNLRLAIDDPLARGLLRRMLLIGVLHLAFSLVLSLIANQSVHVGLAVIGSVCLFLVYGLVGASGVTNVLLREGDAVRCIRALERAVRRPAA